ncbi:MAG: FG-GAP-like repeat-containing protein [Burkholderiaceae bacterium]
MTPSHTQARNLARRKFFRGITNFLEFERRTSAEPVSKAQGDAFEVLVEAFLYTEPTYAARKVWPVGKIPLKIRQKLGIPSGTKGIDGVYEDRISDFVPYQAKFRSSNEPSFKDTSSFFRITEGWRGQRLLITNRPTVDKDARTRCSSLVRHHFEQYLTPQRFVEIEKWLDGSIARSPRIKPRKDQESAFLKITDELRRASRATAVMAFGTGKTLVSVWAAEKQNPKTVLVLVPSLSLMTQTVPEWCQQSKWAEKLQFICVCSDKSVVSEEDGADVPPGEAGFPVTTERREIKKFLSRNTSALRVVFSTYGNANDMIAMDFNKDGWMDIVVASTKQKPYYDGRAIQFLRNQKDGTFTDVTKQVHPDVARYENGTGTPLWNGEGQLFARDYDGDGDLDIIDSVSETYVLINNGAGTYQVQEYTSLPAVDRNASGLWPVNINRKGQLDFISYRTLCDSSSCTTSYYQVVD